MGDKLAGVLFKVQQNPVHFRFTGSMCVHHQAVCCVMLLCHAPDNLCMCPCVSSLTSSHGPLSQVEGPVHHERRLHQLLLADEVQVSGAVCVCEWRRGALSRQWVGVAAPTSSSVISLCAATLCILLPTSAYSACQAVAALCRVTVVV